MKLCVVVCEDLEEERYALARMIQRYADEKGIELRLDTCGSGEELMDLFAPGRWDILFLDIYMGALSGAEAARQIRARDADCALIFCTTSREHGMLSYEVRVSDYLVKPFTDGDVRSALDWVLEERRKKMRTLTVRAEWNEVEIPLSELQYVEIQRNDFIFHLEKRSLRARGVMAELEQTLRGGGFYRCHRSFLVNFDHVSGVEREGFRMRCGDLVPVSPRQKDEAKLVFMDWVLEKSWGKPGV